VRASALDGFAANDETQELVIGREPLALAFPLHTLVMRRYFDEIHGR
jgi:hypothetical protein